MAKEGNIRGAAVAELRRMMTVIMGGLQGRKKHAEKKCLSTPLCEWVLSCPN